MYQVYKKKGVDLNKPILNTQLYNHFFFFFWSLKIFIPALSSVVQEGKRWGQKGGGKTTIMLTSKNCQPILFIAALIDMHWKIFSAMNSWRTTRTIYTLKDTFQRPVFARFIPLELNGDTLPLGPGLSSLKFEFSIANSRSCCLLIQSCDSSCTSKVNIQDKMKKTFTSHNWDELANWLAYGNFPVFDFHQ